ncbi:hypothetical protein ZEAMMB73_Zm00001d025756 [Zea mays]|uniref:Uncharacterized protein n=1 Tax=Zea mays TaxID=4577 RepID=A0A1D6J9B2_MAIZE|nr:hypothetical protein ZEAMMB73_Zm00001d025756 [Zea mays]
MYIGGPTGEILETNSQVLSQISTNLSNIYRTTSLCCAKLEIIYSGS